jgi:hypothetical protein
VSPFFLWGPGYYYTPPLGDAYVQPNGYWYYCQSAGAYYPYVTACPEAWVPVEATP